ncbi:hypothetical protein ABPG77_003160 [Micractinium sp. CCAP 211/92]
MAAAGEQVEALFARLDTAVKNGQAKKGIKAADEILKLAPGDQDALRCKAVLLIEAGRMEEALKLLGEPSLATSMAFEKAYCLYRSGKLQDALSSLGAVPADKEVARLQLEAQIQYRLGNSKEAIALYSQLFRAHGTETREVQTNVLAAYVAGGRAGEVPAVMEAMKISPKDSFEVAFNAACGLIEGGKLGEAEEQLQLAVRVGEEALYDEDFQEEEVALELAPVTAQLAYVADRLGRGEEATASYEQLLKLELDDATTASVATNNLFAALLRAAPSTAVRKVASDCLKKLEPFMERSGGLLRLKSSLELRLGAVQREALLASYATAALLANRVDVAKEAVRSIEKQLSGAAITAMLQASLLSREGKAKEADAVLAALATSSDAAQAAEAQLLRAQLAAASGNAAAALQHLAGVGSEAWQARPAVLATKVALMEELGQAEEAAAGLDSALRQWQAAPDSAVRSEALRWIVERLAALHLRRGALQEAAGLYQQLLSLDASALSEPGALSSYARLAAVCDPAAATRLGSQLGPAGAGLPAAELDALENANIAASGARRRVAEDAIPVPAAAKQAGAAAAEGEKKKRKRKRQPRYPKGFDPANPGPPPDPERWLPKWQRSDAKKSRKKMKGKEVKGSQGAGKVDESLDRTNAAMPEESGPKVPAKLAGKAKGKKGGRR